MKKTKEQIAQDYENLPETVQEELSKMIDEKKMVVETEGSKEEALTPEETFSYEEILAPEQDRAERYGLAMTIADHIAITEKFRSFSINGSWGTGKTVFMGWLRQSLVRRKTNRVVVIPFQAWKSEATGNLVVSLLIELRRISPGRTFEAKINSHLKKVIAAAAVLWGAGYIAPIIGVKEAISILWLALKSYFTFGKASETKTLALADLQTEFTEAANYILKSYNEPAPRKIVFLIDELDRCLPENVLKLLESIKNFLQTENTCFVFSIDKEIVARAINANYPTLSDLDAEEYLEKFIQFSYELPFNHQIVWSGIVQDLVMEFKDLLSTDIKFGARLFEISSVTSIRKMKRIANRYAIIQLELKRIGANVDTQILFLVIFIYETYPKLYEVLKDNRRQQMIDSVQAQISLTDDQLAKQPPIWQALAKSVRGTRAAEVIIEFKKLTNDQNTNRGIAGDVNSVIELMLRVGA